jgi:hypothetical protein
MDTELEYVIFFVFFRVGSAFLGHPIALPACILVLPGSRLFKEPEPGLYMPGMYSVP